MPPVRRATGRQHTKSRTTQLSSELPAITAELFPKVIAALEASADLVVERAKERVPVDTGRLRDSIHKESNPATPEGVYVRAGGKVDGTDVFYGHMVEFGTVHDAAEPFLIPALEESKRDILRLVRKGIKRAARQ